MLHALASEKKYSFLSNAVPQPKPKVFAPPVPSLSNQSQLQMLQKKSDCACGGQCTNCQGKASSLNFVGDLDDVFSFAPDVTKPKKGMPDFIDKAIKDCNDICDTAYADPALNRGGGGVVCKGSTKCACVFDVAPLTRGQCPDFDHIVWKHEIKHIDEGECPPGDGMSRLKAQTAADRTRLECIHRKESIDDIKKALPEAKGNCKTGMETIKTGLEEWVAAHNC
jgi:hypothetical protein